MFDSVGKLLEVAPVVEGTLQLGYPESTIFGMGVALLVWGGLYFRDAALRALIPLRR